eukprot:1196324-Prymnesium_polylepis.1
MGRGSNAAAEGTSVEQHPVAALAVLLDCGEARGVGAAKLHRERARGACAHGPQDQRPGA